jgi:ferredoxin-NADP reductase
MFWLRPFGLAVTLMFVLLPSGEIRAQMSEAEHLSHHAAQPDPAAAQTDPGQAPGAIPAAGGTTSMGPPAGAGPPGGMGGMGGMGTTPAAGGTPAMGPPAGAGPPGGMGAMGGMMKMMGGLPPQKELYPSLMDMPELSPEKKVALLAAADERMKVGTTLLSSGVNHLSQAISTNDFDTMQEATAQIRQGLAQLESGIATHRGVAEGKPPREIALQWFRSQMNLPQLGMNISDSGISWFHLTIMIILILFAIVMIWMYFFKMRRASQLLARLTGGGQPGEGGTGTAKTNPADKVSPAPTDAKPAPSPKPATPAVASPTGSNKQVSPAPTEAKLASPPKAASPVVASPPSTHGKSTPPPTGKWKGILRINRIFEETPNVKTFRFTAMDGGAIPFTYLPGQFLTISAMSDGKPVQRNYTIASSPTQRYYCELTIKREEHGVMSRYLDDGMQEGELLEIAGPNGKFTFNGTEAKSVVLIGGGVGVTPFMGMVRYLTDIGWGNDIFLLYTCRHVHDYIFREELERLCARHPKLHLTVTITQRGEEPWSGLTGHLTKEVIAKAVPEIATRLVYVCGPDRMMKGIQAALLELDVPATQVKTEAFGAGAKAPVEKVKPDAESAAAAVTPETDATKPAATDQPPPAEEGTAAPPAVDPAATGATAVTFKRSGKSSPLPPDKSILEASEDAGVNIDFECRVGTCGTCKVHLLSGDVTMEVEEGLDPGDKEKNIILACQAKSNAAVVVDAYVARAEVKDAGPKGA